VPTPEGEHHRTWQLAELEKQPRRTKLRFPAEVTAKIEFPNRIRNIKGTRV